MRARGRGMSMGVCWFEISMWRGRASRADACSNGLERTGLARLKEALEANEWTIDDEGEEGFGIEEELGLGLEEEEGLGVELGGEGKEAEGEMRKPILGREDDLEDDLREGAWEGGDEEVRQLERMMLKMHAVKGECFRVLYSWNHITES